MKHPTLHKTLTPRRACSGLRPPATLLASLVMFGGCASLPPDLVTSGGLRLERTDSRYAHVGRVSARTVDSVLRVKGEVTQRYGRRGPIPGHLHITAIGDRSALLATTKTGYHRLSVKAHKAQFSDTLPVDAREIRTIRIIHHGFTHRS